jgi:hypothetical protein
MPSTIKIAEKLRELDPRSRDYYSLAARYFGEHARAHRNYGRFFIGFGLLSWVGVFAGTSALMVCGQLFNFCFASAVGWLVLVANKRIAHALAQADVDSDAEDRLESLRKVALLKPYDPVSDLILEHAKKEANAA